MSEITRTGDRDIEHTRSFDPERGAFTPLQHPPLRDPQTNLRDVRHVEEIAQDHMIARDRPRHQAAQRRRARMIAAASAAKRRLPVPAVRLTTPPRGDFPTATRRRWTPLPSTGPRDVRKASRLRRGLPARAVVDRYELAIEPSTPFRLDLTAWALRRRSHNEVDRFDAFTYRRVVTIDDGGPVAATVTQDAATSGPRPNARLVGRAIDERTSFARGARLTGSRG